MRLPATRRIGLAPGDALRHMPAAITTRNGKGSDMTLVLGFATIVFAALFHHLGLTVASSITPDFLRKMKILPVIVFAELAIIHIAEIALFATAYLVLSNTLYPGSFGGEFAGRWTDWFYFSGINFTTLGYTGIDISGPLRVVSMLQSLGGFMLLTWSASYLSSACGEYFAKD